MPCGSAGAAETIHTHTPRPELVDFVRKSTWEWGTEHIPSLQRGEVTVLISPLLPAPSAASSQPLR